MPPSCTTPVPLAELESELLGLAGHIAAAQSRFLVLLAEFDDRGGWAGPGLRSCAHWLSWRAGMSLRTATEQVRVAHALTHLPLVAAAFAAGTVSYSKVRAITRVAVPDTSPASTGGSPAAAAEWSRPRSAGGTAAGQDSAGRGEAAARSAERADPAPDARGGGAEAPDAWERELAALRSA
jgi:hypothetical protein